MCERPNCRNCKKRHHQSLCDQGKLHNAYDASLGAGSSISQKSQEIIRQESATTQTEETDVVTATTVSSRTTVVSLHQPGENMVLRKLQFLYYSIVGVSELKERLASNQLKLKY